MGINRVAQELQYRIAAAALTCISEKLGVFECLQCSFDDVLSSYSFSDRGEGSKADGMISPLWSAPYALHPAIGYPLCLGTFLLIVPSHD